MQNLKVLRLVFASQDTLGVHRYTKLGTFSNCILHVVGSKAIAARAKLLFQNCLATEKDFVLGYCIDDGSFDTLNVPHEKVKQIQL